MPSPATQVGGTARRATMPATAIGAVGTSGSAVLLALGCALAAAVPPAACAEQGGDAEAAARDRALVMKRFIVSATRIEKNPWRYAYVPGFEVLSRASAHETNWELDALRRGLWLQDNVLPEDWRPASPVPYMVIIDETNLETAPGGPIHTQPILFRSPADSLTWGDLSDRIDISTDPVSAYDRDTFAINSNLYGVDTRKPAYASVSLERVFRCAPPLPRWLVAGLLGEDSGVFRESFGLFAGMAQGSSGSFLPWIRRADGPGTLWVSLDETERLLAQFKREKKEKKEKREKKATFEVPPLRVLFAEEPSPGDSQALWESEAALFVRWGLMGPGHADPDLSRAFVKLVRRARIAPVTEQVFAECFGFGYAAMEEKLGAFLRAVLATPTSIDMDMPLSFPEADLRAATADQIGRILGDWLRMQGDSLRGSSPELSREFLVSAGRMLERAYRDDNGLPPDVDPSREGGRSADLSKDAARGSPIVLKPFVVTADRIHDPNLLAVYGLYEHEAGNDEKAREFLEAAVKFGVVRPRAYLVLAKMRYVEAIAIPRGAEGELSAEQASSILAPLRTALQFPPDPEVYRLIVETWNRSDEKPAEGDVEKFVEGVAQFPRDTGLAYSSALACARGGYASKANELIDKGLVFATHENDRRYFEELRSTLSAPPAAGAR
jgi:hypothetical protein